METAGSGNTTKSDTKVALMVAASCPDRKSAYGFWPFCVHMEAEVRPWKEREG